MSEDLLNEIEVINSIYGPGTLTPTSSTSTHNIYSLQISCFTFPLRIQFDANYPASPPTVLGSDTAGIEISREESSHAVEIFKTVLRELFVEGQVCLYDVIEEVIARYQAQKEEGEQDILKAQSGEDDSSDIQTLAMQRQESDTAAFPDPEWIISSALTELKSTFIAHACVVTSPTHAKHALSSLLSSSKKLSSATHNITAWRIRSSTNPHITYQESDDDGETAAGGRLLHLMQLMDLWNVMVIVTRWYGGHHLGPRRFSLINSVAREVFVKGGWVEDGEGRKKGKK